VVVGQTCLFDHDRVPDADLYLDQIEQCFGMKPRSWVGINALTGTQEAHQVLGELILHLGTQHHGLICYDNRLWPWWDLTREDPRRQLKRWQDVKPHFAALIDGMPGKILELGDFHVADVDFARAWLSSPAFHM
jgi:hypothetical protein